MTDMPMWDKSSNREDLHHRIHMNMFVLFHMPTIFWTWQTIAEEMLLLLQRYGGAKAPAEVLRLGAEALCKAREDGELGIEQDLKHANTITYQTTRTHMFEVALFFAGAGGFCPR